MAPIKSIKINIPAAHSGVRKIVTRSVSKALRGSPPVSKMTQFTDDQFQKLLATIQAMNVAPPVVTISNNGTFANCLSRYDGKSNVEVFITDIDMYKDSANVSDELAFKGFRMLLSGDVAEWWDGIKSTVADYNKAKDLLRSTYGERRPNYKIYQDIYTFKQTPGMSIDYFVTKVRALFAKLTVTEDMQLDMIYGQLSLKLRDKVKRTAFTTYDKLLELARAEELFLDDVESEAHVGSASRNEPKIAKPKISCVYCRQFGHSRDVCPKLAKRKEVSNMPSPGDMFIKSEVKCYGCGNPGFIRSKCPKCTSNSPKSNTAPPPSAFSSLYTDELTLYPRARPLVPIQVFWKNGTGLLDTASCSSIASDSLKTLLHDNNTEFKESNISIKLADGSIQRNKRVYVTEISISILRPMPSVLNL